MYIYDEDKKQFIQVNYTEKTEEPERPAENINAGERVNPAPDYSFNSAAAEPQQGAAKLKPAVPTWKRVVSIALAAIICFGCGFGGSWYAFNLQEEKAAEKEFEESVTYIGSGNTVTYDLNVDSDLTVSEAVASKVMPSVVGISTVSTQTYSTGSFFGFGGGGSYSQDVSSVGTGVIVDESGYILTNSHVVNDGDTKSITVSLYDGTDVEGTVLWCDSTLDLAVVKIDAKNLAAAELGDSDKVTIGSYAAAIGNPLGLSFERSISQGIISGLDRTISVSSDSSSSGASSMEGLIQTDATINSGNSGGPLLNAKGQVIGINTAKASSGEGMGFAIPINVAKPIIEQIKETGSFNRAYIGIKGIGLGEQTQYTSTQLQEYFGTTTGVYVSSVISGGGAEKAGIRERDIIISVDGVEVDSMNKINAQIIKHTAGDSVHLEIVRDKEVIELDVTLTEEIQQKYTISQ